MKNKNPALQKCQLAPTDSQPRGCPSVAVCASCYIVSLVTEKFMKKRCRVASVAYNVTHDNSLYIRILDTKNIK